MKKLINRLRWWKLDRDIRAGRKARGRVPPKPPGVKARWLEFCLRIRTLREAVRFVFSTPVTGNNSVHEGAVFPTGRLFAKKVKLDEDGNVVEELEDLGLISTKVVTNAGVAFLVDAWQNSVELEALQYHACGTSGTAESATDTALGAQTGSRVSSSSVGEGASANIVQLVGTISFTSTLAIVEHGIFSAASGGTLWDRSVFSAINVVNGDAIQFTYECTFPAGS